MLTQQETQCLLHVAPQPRRTSFFLFAPPPPRHVRPHERSRQRTHTPTADSVAAHCISVWHSGPSWWKTRTLETPYRSMRTYVVVWGHLVVCHDEDTNIAVWGHTYSSTSLRCTTEGGINNIASVGQLGEKLRATLARWKHLVITLRYCQHPKEKEKKKLGRFREKCDIVLRYYQLPPPNLFNRALTLIET